MLVPDDLDANSKIYKLNKQIQVTRYVENSPSKIQTDLQENLLVIVVEGKKRITSGDFTGVISKGEFGLIRKGKYMMNQILTNQDYESLLIFISDEYMLDIPQRIKDKRIFSDPVDKMVFVKGLVGEHMNQEVMHILSLVKEKEESYDEILNLKIRELILYLLSGESSNEILRFVKSCQGDNVDFHKYMEENYTRSIEIQDMARELNMSVSTFKRRFIKIYGETPGKWILNKRIEMAKKLLRTTDYLIADICFLCGFESISTFNVQFKKKMGITPGKYVDRSLTIGQEG